MEAFDSLRNSITMMTAIPAMEWLHFAKHLRLRQIEKNAHYFKIGDEVSEIGFVVKGLLYNYYSKAKGDEIVKIFLPEGVFVASYSSLIMKTPSSFSCRAIENTILLTIPYKEMEAIYDRHICWQRLGRISAEQQFIAKEKREMEFLLDDATVRYQKFVEQNEKILNRIPQYLIASYIGISPASLSRIRGQI